MMKLCSLMFLGASAQTFTNCNTDETVPVVTNFSMVPDPPVPGQDVFFHVETVYPNTTIQNLNIIVDVDAGPIQFEKMSIPVTLAAPLGAPNTPLTVDVGPFQWPTVHIPLIPFIHGKVQMVDSDHPWVNACIEYRLKKECLHAPAGQHKILQESLQNSPAGFRDCSDPAQPVHLNNFEVQTTPEVPKKGRDLSMKFSGVLDEEVTEMMVSTEFDISIVKMSGNVPVKISPGIGSLAPQIMEDGVEATVGPWKLPFVPLIPNVKGNIHLTDKADGTGETIMCLDLNLPIMGEASMISI